jgi:dolichol kinase
MSELSDLALVALWLTVLVAGLGGCLVLRAAGLASTYVRDLLHVGAGVWVLGWSFWDARVVPVAIVAVVAVAVAMVPALAPRVRLVRGLRDSVSGGDERWIGLVHYTIAYTTFTALGLWGARMPAAAALLSLSLGDGIGGAVGRRFGRHHFTSPWGKRKSVEGSAVVALGAATAVVIASALAGVQVSAPAVIVLALVASAAEAVAPRGTDNLLLPASVWIAAHLVS